VKLTTQILLGLGLGVLVGVAVQTIDAEGARTVLIGLTPIGTAFIRLISMVVVPLVVASLFVGVCSTGDLRRLGRVGGRTFAYFLVTSVIAAVIGLYLAVLVRPGAALAPEVRDRIAAEYAEGSDARAAAARELSLVDRIVEMIPRNPVQAAADMDLLGLIVFTLVFAAAVTTLREERRQTLVEVADGVNRAMAVIIEWVMKVTPYAVFILIAGALARFGVELLQGLLLYAVLIVAGELFHAFVVLSLALRLGGVRVLAFWRNVVDAPVLAFATASSNATLPVTLEVAQERLGVSNEVASFVLPIGATLNMNGGALYKGLTAAFLAQVYGIPLGPAEHVTIVVTSTMAALAGVGVPGSSLITTMIVLTAIGMGPQAAAGIALVVGLDRFLDMFRTGVNVLGDLTAAAIVAKAEGEVLRA
jgi:Na+/H+-dicarboxylate symporter